MPYLQRQIEIIGPELILCLGSVAGNALLNKKLSLAQMRGNVYDFGGIKLMVTYHPAALLRTSEYKRPAWEDLKRVRALLAERMGSDAGES